MTSRSPSRRRTLVAVLAPLAIGGALATASPAQAVPFEGEPTSGQCVRIVQLFTGGAGSTLFVSHGRVAVLADGVACSAATT